MARKKGLEDYFEKADGSPRPKKQEPAPIAPVRLLDLVPVSHDPIVITQAPGTFGYDDTKYRRGRADDDDDDIEMDEFGRPKGSDTIVEDDTADIPEEPEPQEEDDGHSRAPVSTTHDNTRAPVNPPPISPPFSDYAPTTVQDISYPAGVGKQGVAVEQDEKGAGCCKCVIM